MRCSDGIGLILKQGIVSKVLVERFGKGEDILERLTDLVQKNHISAGSFTAIGTVEKATVGYFIGDGQYSNTAFQGPLEVVSCMGNVSLKDGHPFVHAHMIFADREGKTIGGHLMPGTTVDATFEVTLHAYEDVKLFRKQDPRTKLLVLDT
jgi:predicted DNA-binding protein with PD1-like motif